MYIENVWSFPTIAWGCIPFIIIHSYISDHVSSVGPKLSPDYIQSFIEEVTVEQW